jgi:hypothetical protein
MNLAHSRCTPTCVVFSNPSISPKPDMQQEGREPDSQAPSWYRHILVASCMEEVKNSVLPSRSSAIPRLLDDCQADRSNNLPSPRNAFSSILLFLPCLVYRSQPLSRLRVMSCFLARASTVRMSVVGQSLTLRLGFVQDPRVKSEVIGNGNW